MEKGQSSGVSSVSENILTRGVINVIAGGQIDGDFNRAHKTYARLMEFLSIQDNQVAWEHSLLGLGQKTWQE